MSILFLTLGAFSGFPSYKRAVGMGEALALQGKDVHIAVLDCEENRSRMSVEAPHCVPEWFNASNRVMEVWHKIKIVWHVRPDVLFMLSYGLRSLAYLSILLPRRTKVVIEFAELYSAFLGSRITWAIKEYLAIIESDALTVASLYLKNVFQARVKRLHLRRPICYLPFAYPDYLKPICQVDDGVYHIVFMAAIRKEYGVYEVLEAFSRILKERTDVQLDIIGGGKEKQNVVNLVQERQLASSIKVHGYVAEDQLNSFFSKADVFVAPMHDSLQDWARCPSKVFYYIPYNRPVVTCKIGNPYDILGESGFYYEPNNVQDMARAIGEALNASSTFAYPKDFNKAHSWNARANDFHKWMGRWAQ